MLTFPVVDAEQIAKPTIVLGDAPCTPGPDRPRSSALTQAPSRRSRPTRRPPSTARIPWLPRLHDVTSSTRTFGSVVRRQVDRAEVRETPLVLAVKWFKHCLSIKTTAP